MEGELHRTSATTQQRVCPASVLPQPRPAFCYAIVLPGREIGLPGRISAGTYFAGMRSGSLISNPKALLCNARYHGAATVHGR